MLIFLLLFTACNSQKPVNSALNTNVSPTRTSQGTPFKGTRILFIGISVTDFGGGLPKQLIDVAQSKGKNVAIAEVIKNGTSVGSHLENYKAHPTDYFTVDAHYDYVVLQGWLGGDGIYTLENLQDLESKKLITLGQHLQPME